MLEVKKLDMMNKWAGHRAETIGGEVYGIEETYRKAAAFLGSSAEDWGCGTCYARKFFETYWGVDGTPDYADAQVDLTAYTSHVESILLRHVLEHNLEWEKILTNAMHSCKRLAVVICTPFGDETNLIHIDKFEIPVITFRKEDLTKHFTNGYTEEEVIGRPCWGTEPVSETIFYVNGL